jgi:hypothetical protein
MKNVTTAKDRDIDRLLSALGSDQPAVPDALMARILADAAAVQDDMQPPRGAIRPVVPTRRMPLWGRIAAAVGGGKVLAGLGSAAVAGLAFGFVEPAPLTTLASTVLGQSFDISVDLWPLADDFLSEG